MKKILSYAIALATAACILPGCDEYEEPDHFSPVILPISMTLSEFKSLMTGAAWEVDSDIVIGGQVVSSDFDGNIYRSLFIQDETGGLEVMEGTSYGMYNKYHVGQMIYIKARGLTLAPNSSALRLGYRTTSYPNTYLDNEYLIKKTIFKGYVYAPIVPKVLTTRTELMAAANMSSLVTIKGITYTSGNTNTVAHPRNTWAFGDDGNTVANEAAYGAQYFNFTDGSGQFEVRTSGYAKFAETLVPFTPGTAVEITGIISGIYNSSPQITLNSDRDVVVVN